MIFAGTDDGNVWVTQNDGGNWTNVSWFLPERWVTRVAADPFDEAAAYVTFSGYRYDEYLPHVFRTTDFGQSWTDISGDLPEVPVNDIIPDPTLDSALYIATDVGVFVSWNQGQNWGLLGEGLPNVPVCDLDFHDELRMLLAATYGRSMYTIDVDQFVGVHETVLPENALSIYPNPASEYICIDVNGKAAGQFRITDMQGKTILEGWIDLSTEAQVDISDLESGAYLYVLECDGEVKSGRFIRR